MSKLKFKYFGIMCIEEKLINVMEYIIVVIFIKGVYKERKNYEILFCIWFGWKRSGGWECLIFLFLCNCIVMVRNKFLFYSVYLIM